MALDIKERFVSYTERWPILWYGVKCFFECLLNSFGRVGDRTFARMYTCLKDDFAKCEADASPVPRLVALADGATLELGPGCGTQHPRFNLGALTQVYGIEPNAEIIPALQDSVQAIPELQAKYTIINAAFEDEEALKAHGIVDNSLDTIVCMQVMCSVPDAAAAAKLAHRLLKPGGQFLFWEHEASRDGLTRVVQRIWNTLWTPLLGGCMMGIPVEAALVNAGPWDIVELGHDHSRPYNLLPRVWGRFVKRKE